MTVTPSRFARISGPDSGDMPPAADDGFVRHHCTCRKATVLGSYGLDAQGRYCYKIIWRDRVVVIYFGAFTVKCKDCRRWCRVRMLPKEKKVQINPLRQADEDGGGELT